MHQRERNGELEARVRQDVLVDQDHPGAEEDPHADVPGAGWSRRPHRCGRRGEVGGNLLPCYRPSKEKGLRDGRPRARPGSPVSYCALHVKVRLGRHPLAAIRASHGAYCSRPPSQGRAPLARLRMPSGCSRGGDAVVRAHVICEQGGRKAGCPESGCRRRECGCPQGRAYRCSTASKARALASRR